MMFVDEREFREIFALAVAAKAAKRLDENMARFNVEMDQRQRRQHKAAEKEEKELEELEKMADTGQIAQFYQRLEEYDTKTVDALMENGEALDEVRKQLRQQLENSYVLPDGRHVFKSSDGQRVFDEHGAEVGHDIVDPQMIDGTHTSLESFKATKAAELKLEAERHELIEFQIKLDEARARLDKGGLTQKEFDKLRTDLEANAPASVRQKLGLEEKPGGGDVKRRSDDISVDDLMPKVDQPSRYVGTTPAPM